MRASTGSFAVAATVQIMSVPPSLTTEERRAALKKAGEARQIRAQLKEKLKHGKMQLSDVIALARNDEVVGKTKVLSVLESLPGVGKVKARRLMRDIGISESRRIRGLGTQQRRNLLDALA